MTNVARQTISSDLIWKNGLGVDWSEEELAILMRDDLSPREMCLMLPHRTRKSVYVKRSRIGVARPYHRSKLHLLALKQSHKAQMNRRLRRIAT